MKLSKKLTIIIIAIALFISVVVNTFGYITIDNLFIDNLYKNQNIIADNLLTQLDKTIYEQLKNSSNMTLTPSFVSVAKGEEMDEEEYKKFLSDVTSTKVNFGIWKSITILDIDGNIKFTEKINEELDSIIKENPNLITLPQSGQTAYTDALFSNGDTLPSIYFSVPIRDFAQDSKPLVGILISELYWVPLLEIFETYSEYNIYVVNTDSKIILSNDKNKLGVVCEETNFKEYENGDKHFTDCIFDKSIKVYGTVIKQKGYLDFKGNEWSLIIGTPQNDFQKNINDIYGKILLVTVGLILLYGFTVSLVIEKQIIEKIETITQVTQNIVRGDIHTKSEIKSKDELGALSNNLNSMLSELSKQRSEIEKEIKDRTEKLEKLNELMVGRELKMIELKKEIRKLKEENEKK